MKYIERYALAAGLKIGKQYVKEDFFPLPFTRYITLHASAGMQGKTYPYYSEVLTILKSCLDWNDIKIVQIGGKDDIPLPGCYHIMGRYSFNQGSYIIRNSMLHLGNDSVWGHRAGHIGIPLVQPWGTTSSMVHSCYDSDPSKTIHIESHRWGRQPTFSAQENPSTIALVPPESLANAVFQLLGFSEKTTQKTIHIGALYNTAMLEWIPNCAMDPAFNAHLPLTARMDLHFDENALVNMLRNRKINIITNKAINPQILSSFKDHILTYNHEILEDAQPEYLRIAKTIIPRSVFFSRTRDPSILSSLRFKFFDYITIEHGLDKTRDDLLNDSKSYLNRSLEDLLSEKYPNHLDKSNILGILSFKTTKYIVSRNKIYPSHAHESLDIPFNELGVYQVIDNEVFMREINHHRMFL